MNFSQQIFLFRTTGKQSRNFSTSVARPAIFTAAWKFIQIGYVQNSGRSWCVICFLRTRRAGTYPPVSPRSSTTGSRKRSRFAEIRSRQEVAIETIRLPRADRGYRAIEFIPSRRARPMIRRRGTRSIDGYKSSAIVEGPKFPACLEQRNAIVFANGRYDRTGKRKEAHRKGERDRKEREREIWRKKGVRI